MASRSQGSRRRSSTPASSGAHQPVRTAAHHGDEELADLKCFYCEKPVRDELDGPVPVFGEVQLHRSLPVKFIDPKTHELYLTNLSLEYRRVIVTTAMAWLCSQHSDFMELPLRMAWPPVAPSALPDRP